MYQKSENNLRKVQYRGKVKVKSEKCGVFCACFALAGAQSMGSDG
jgi:hypothetical protein